MNTQQRNSQLIQRLLNIHPASSPAFSADGKRLSFIMNLSGVPQVWSVPHKPGSKEIIWPRQESYSEERIQGFWPSPLDSLTLIYASDRGGDENALLYLCRKGQIEDLCLTPISKKVMHVFGQWSADGKKIVYSSNKRHPGYFDLYLRPLDGEEKMIWRNDQYGMVGGIHLSMDEQKLYITLMQTSFRHELLEIDVASGSTRTISPTSQEARYEQIGLLPDGRTLLLLTDVDSDFLYIGRYDLETHAFTKLLTQNADIDHFQLTQNGQNLVYTVNRGGYNELHSYDLAKGETVQAALPAIKGVIGEPSPFILNSGLDISPDGGFVAFTYTTPLSDSNIYLWDITGNEVYPVTQAPMGGLPAEEFAYPKIVEYPSFDGRNIPGLLYKPGKEFNEPFPVIVIVHGGPVGQSRLLLTSLSSCFCRMVLQYFCPM